MENSNAKADHNGGVTDLQFRCGRADWRQRHGILEHYDYYSYYCKSAPSDS
jgi:hypothetical protein